MTNNSTDSRPLDLSDLREADTLGQAWDAWLHDDIEPTRHHASRSLEHGIAATVQDLYDAWDDAPAPDASFRRGLKRDLLHMHDALRATSAPDAVEHWTVSSAHGHVALPPGAPVATLEPQPVRPKRWRLVRRWWPAMEFTAAAMLILALFGVTFGNARIAEFFRDDERGHFAAQGDSTQNPVTPFSETAASTDTRADQSVVAGEPAVSGGFDSPDGVDVPIIGTLGEKWATERGAMAESGAAPIRIAVGEGFVATVSVDSATLATTLTLFESESGTRLWRAQVDDHVEGTTGGNEAAPLIADGKVYFVNRAGFLYIIDIKRYLETFLPEIALQLPIVGVAERMLLTNGVLYVAGGDGTHVPSMAGAGSSIFVVGTVSNAIVGIDAETGAIVDHKLMPKDGMDPSQPKLYRYDLASARVGNVWDQDATVPVQVSVINGGILAVVFAAESETTPGVRFFTATDMNEIDLFEAETFADPAALTGEAVVVSLPDEEGFVELHSLQGGQTSTLLESAWDFSSYPRPVIGGSSTIVVANDSTMQLFDPASGALVGETALTPERGLITALETFRGSVYVTFEDGTVARFVPEATLGQVDAMPVAPRD